MKKIVLTNPNLPKFKEKDMAGYNDAKVVALVNACLDYEKLRHLPPGVLDRFKLLLRRRRVGAVCFFLDCGFGLRVYDDTNQLNVSAWDEDEASVNRDSQHGSGSLNLDGFWVRCQPLKEVDEYLVMNSRGTAFVQVESVFYNLPGSKSDPSDDDDDESDDSANEDRVRWTLSVAGSGRQRAKVFTKDQADAVAVRVNGIVVQK